MERVVIVTFFAVCSMMAIGMVVNPALFTDLNIRYFRWVLTMLGYEVEIRPMAPGRPERFARGWGVICLMFFLVMLIFGLITTK